MFRNTVRSHLCDFLVELVLRLSFLSVSVPKTIGR